MKGNCWISKKQICLYNENGRSLEEALSKSFPCSSCYIFKQRTHYVTQIFTILLLGDPTEEVRVLINDLRDQIKELKTDLKEKEIMRSQTNAEEISEIVKRMFQIL